VVILSVDALNNVPLGPKIAIVSQTTRKYTEFMKIVNYLVERVSEVRVFNTICNATFENQDAARELSQNSDIMIVIGGKNSSNTKQLLNISEDNCQDCYLIENEKELDPAWFDGKKKCGVTAGASTPEWIIEKIISKIREFTI
jgi:4-hydroxy-3-methylbut-2-enyl diphosphate reductase